MNFLASPLRGVLKNDDAATGFDHTAPVEHNDFARQPPGFTKIMGRHHDLDAALADRAEDILDGLGGGGIEIRGWLIKEQHFRVAGERTSQREALLFAT